MDQINPIEVKDITLCILGNLGDHLCLTCSSIFLDAKIELIANVRFNKNFYFFTIYSYLFINRQHLIDFLKFVLNMLIKN